MKENWKLKFSGASVVMVIVFIMIMVTATSGNNEKKEERQIKKNQRRVENVKPRKNTKRELKEQLKKDLATIEEAIETGSSAEDDIDKLLEGLSYDKSKEYKSILERDDFINMEITLYSENGQIIWTREAFNASIERGLGGYMLYEKDPDIVFKRTMIDPGENQSLVIKEIK